MRISIGHFGVIDGLSALEKKVEKKVKKKVEKKGVGRGRGRGRKVQGFAGYNSAFENYLSSIHP